ncbi:DNA primase [Myxococcota bacterium]|nr:DNA primase [Myxococcota bacterium]
MAPSYDATVQEIRARIDIVELIGRHVQLKKVGASFKACCPFHREKTPSFHVHPHRQFYYCFGCGAKGDIFNFLMEYEGKSFGDVVREQAQALHIPLPDAEIDYVKVSEQEAHKEKLYHLLQIAQHFFQNQLSQPSGEDARNYLHKRGVNASMIQTFGLGYAPDNWGALRDHLEKQGQDIQLACEAGLLKEGEKSKRPYDRFRHRLMFPIWLPTGRLVGFGGRALRDLDGAKYLNSPESPLFQKSDLLYGLHLAHSTIRHASYAILVEGYMDVIAMHQFGFNEAIATLGTSLTEAHCKLLHRYTQKLILLFDGDEAGIKAAERSLALLLPAGFSVDALFLPDKEDPDSYLQRHGRDAFSALLQKEKRPAFDLWLQQLLQRASNDPVQIRDATEKVLGVLRDVSDPLLQDLYIRRVGEIFGLEEAVLRRQMMRLLPSHTKPLLSLTRPSETTHDTPASPRALPPPPNALPSEEIIARLLIKSLIDCPEYLPPIPPAHIVSQIQSKIWRPLLERFLLDLEEGAEHSALVASLLQSLTPHPVLKKKMADAFFQEPAFQKDAVSVGYTLILQTLEQANLQRSLRTLCEDAKQLRQPLSPPTAEENTTQDPAITAITAITAPFTAHPNQPPAHSSISSIAALAHAFVQQISQPETMQPTTPLSPSSLHLTPTTPHTNHTTPAPTLTAVHPTPSTATLSESEIALLEQLQTLGRQRLKSPLARFGKHNKLADESSL